MTEFELKYGCNPNQKPSKIFMADGSELPIKVLCGKPGYINFLDAFNGWQLVSELKKATGLPAATSFKHVSPTSAAVGKTLSEAKSIINEYYAMIDEKPFNEELLDEANAFDTLYQQANRRGNLGEKN